MSLDHKAFVFDHRRFNAGHVPRTPAVERADAILKKAEGHGLYATSSALVMDSIDRGVRGPASRLRRSTPSSTTTTP